MLKTKRGVMMRDAATLFALRTDCPVALSNAVFQKRAGVDRSANRGMRELAGHDAGRAVRRVCVQADRYSRQGVRNRSRLAQLFWLFWQRPIP